jgi:hypothetical protein
VARQVAHGIPLPGFAQLQEEAMPVLEFRECLFAILSPDRLQDQGVVDPGKLRGLLLDLQFAGAVLLLLAELSLLPVRKEGFEMAHADEQQHRSDPAD